MSTEDQKNYRETEQTSYVSFKTGGYESLVRTRIFDSLRSSSIFMIILQLNITYHMIIHPSFSHANVVL